jgi:hypothetical protein
MQAVYFGGSRSFAGVVPQVLLHVLAAGHSVHVGCCRGFDSLVVSHAMQPGAFRPSSFSQVRVFASFAQSGAGSCSLSAVGIVQQFAQAGGSVSWLAGGSLAVPLVGRLISRSIAALAGCEAAVFVCPGSGSLAVAAHAVAASIPVYVFGSSVPALIPGCAGSWVASRYFGLACWQWSSAQLSFGF